MEPKFITYDGVRLHIAAWARRVGVRRATLYARLENGWSVKRALTRPRKYQPRHLMTNTPTYRSWIHLVRRCTNQNDQAYPRYGGSGILVCSSWKKFENFFRDMGQRPKGKTLDRIDGNKGYFKANCRWATPSEQQRNRRDARKFTYRGETLSLKDWAERTGISHPALVGRYLKRWPVELALTVPSSKRNSRMRYNLLKESAA